MTEGSGEELQPSLSFEAGWESTLDPHGLAQIMAQTNIYNVRHSTLPRGYARKPGVKAAPVARPEHMMNAEQSEAFSRLLMWSSGTLPASFTARQLKSAYRAAMLKTHPDQGGSSESFHEAKNCYHILFALVKNEA